MADEHWIKQTRERAAIMNEAADRAEAGEDPAKFVLFDGKPFGLTPRWWMADISAGNPYSLTPKRTLRPWTAKEWGARIGEEFLVHANRYRLSKVTEMFVEFSGATYSCDWSVLIDDSLRHVKNLDGSPCGVFEEVK